MIGAMWQRWRTLRMARKNRRDLAMMQAEISGIEQALILIRCIELDPDLRQALRRALGITIAGTRRKATKH